MKIPILLSFLSAIGTLTSPVTLSASPEVRLCGFLETIKDGERLPVVLSGIYAVNPELQIFYDPNQPLCALDVQPSTWIDFSSSAVNQTRLKGLLEQDRRAYVTFKGTLVAPASTGPDNQSLPLVAAYASRVSGRRYGHLSAFRTQLIVDSVLDARPVPASVPWDLVWHEPASPAARLEIRSGEVPRYPPMAHYAGISGEVEVEVRVSSGEVIATDVRSGDRLLAAEAVANIRTWKFPPETTGNFTSRFIYTLEQRKRGASRNPKIELELPFLVKITAPVQGW